MKIVSLNIRKWSRDLNPFDWNHWWVVRTWRQRKFFKEEKPDIICLQERCWPIGKLLLGLWEYKCYGGWKCPTPIYIKKEYKYVLRSPFIDMGNNHGFISVLVQNLHLVNVHFPYNVDYPMVVSPRTVVCGDFNCRFNKLKESGWRNIESVRECAGWVEVDTFQNYKYKEQHGELDHFIISVDPHVRITDFTMGALEKQIEGITIRSGFNLSDHKPIITTLDFDYEKEKS